MVGSDQKAARMDYIAYLGLGSNIGDRVANLMSAIQSLGKLGTVVSVSPLYETEPVGYADQPWFLNCALALKTYLAPEEVLDATLSIEGEMGRIRTVPKGPRIIDLDILFWGDQVLDTPELTIPHPALHERRFVLAPLEEIAPDFRHPIRRKTVKEMLRELPEGYAVRKFNDSRWQSSIHAGDLRT
jgi:2-amino-4-hydroxy-6-hydroxymethyldihydropteridine diphosphokinase